MSAPAQTPPRRAALPPVTALCMASMACVIASGIDLAAHLPRVVPLGAPLGLTVAGGVILVGVVVALGRVRRFAWERFFLVARYGLAAYGVIAGLLAYVFIHDNTRGGPLALLLSSLVIFALDVPIVLGFTVARYHQPGTLPAP